MAIVAEPHPVISKPETRARRVAKPAPTHEERARVRARHRRDEIIGLIAFCAVLAIVFLMRNYSTG
jgi:hypothetical protein